MFDNIKLKSVDSKDKSLSLSDIGLSKTDIEYDKIVLQKDFCHVSDSDIGDLKSWIEDIYLADKNAIDKILFIDCETTHLNGMIISLAMIEYSFKDSKILRKYYKEFNPLVPLDPEATEVHKITEDMIKDAETFDQNKSEVLDYLNSSDIVCAFNAIYDVASILREFERSNVIVKKINYIDLMRRLKNDIQAKNAAGRSKMPNLKEAAIHFNIDLESDALHNALYDTEIMLKVFEAAVESYYE